MQTYIDARKYPGASVLIRRGGREVYYHECGARNVEAGLPWTRDTVARIYSMTKPVTTVAAMMLFERGLFPLDAPLSDILPAFSDMHALVPGAERIDQVEPVACPTLHQLMVHTSGLSYSFNPGPLGDEMARLKLDFDARQGQLADMTDRVAKLPLAFRPGTRWEYSVSIDVLGRVVEVLADQDLDAFFRDNIFNPLGMSKTAFSVPRDTGDRLAALYTPNAGNAMTLTGAEKGANSLRLSDAPEGSPFLDTQMYSGGGGLVGTIDDYMAFAETLRLQGASGGERILGPKTLDFMMRNHLPGDIASMGPSSFAEQPMDGMGFGLGGAVVLDPARARTPGSVGDFSWGGMASTFFWVDRTLDLSVVFFTQLSPSSSYSSRAELKALVHGAILA
ncbi:MAG: serine hydrolase domain-containing protein [Pseudomonadota bacterium]